MKSPVQPFSWCVSGGRGHGWSTIDGMPVEQGRCASHRYHVTDIRRRPSRKRGRVWAGLSSRHQTTNAIDPGCMATAQGLSKPRRQHLLLFGATHLTSSPGARLSRNLLATRFVMALYRRAPILARTANLVATELLRGMALISITVMDVDTFSTCRLKARLAREEDRKRLVELPPSRTWPLALAYQLLSSVQT